MKKSEILQWLVTEFNPLELATPPETRSQLVDNAFLYFNTHSAYKYVEMTNCSANQAAVQVSAKFKQIYQVYPATNAQWLLYGHPLWTLLGLTLLDNLTSDLIQMATAFSHYTVYTGNDFAWTFIPNEDSTVGGQLFIRNLPNPTTNICVIGTRRYSPTDDVKGEHAYVWLREYAKALLKQTEGNLLRKADIINVKNDGEKMYTEGETRQKALEDELAVAGRWLAFAKRF